MKGYFVYKFVKNDEILYIGKTKSLKSRIRSHIRDKDWAEEGVEIYTAKLKNQTDMDIYELYYINSLSPKYNVANSNEIGFSMKLKELKFALYKTITTKSLIKHKESYIKPFHEQYENEDVALSSMEDKLKVNKDVYGKLSKHFGSLDVVVGYKFNLQDCGRGFLSFDFLLSNKTIAHIQLEGTWKDLVLIGDSFYSDKVHNIILDSFNNNESESSLFYTLSAVD